MHIAKASQNEAACGRSQSGGAGATVPAKARPGASACFCFTASPSLRRPPTSEHTTAVNNDWRRRRVSGGHCPAHANLSCHDGAAPVQAWELPWPRGGTPCPQRVQLQQPLSIWSGPGSVCEHSQRRYDRTARDAMTDSESDRGRQIAALPHRVGPSRGWREAGRNCLVHRTQRFSHHSPDRRLEIVWQAHPRSLAWFAAS